MVLLDIAAVVAERRGGAIHVFDTINHFFLIRTYLKIKILNTILIHTGPQV